MVVGERDLYLAECRRLVVEAIRRLAPVDGPDAELYRAVLAYPLREAKGLRPALCIAAARSLGALVDEAVPTATALELFHNAFLVHDDVEDGSERRRGLSTLQRDLGEAQAINVGDAMLALALTPLLENLEVLDLGRALRILELVTSMARETAEGQAMELRWIRDGTWDVSEGDYVRMVRKKTAIYSFVTPLVAGGICARASADTLAQLRRLGEALGVAFQIQDDLLNLEGDPSEVGKEACGDLWEGKRTLVVTHYARTASREEALWATAILDRPRPRGRAAPVELVRRKLRERFLAGAFDRAAWAEIEAAFACGAGPGTKTADEVRNLRERLEAHGSLAAAAAVADRWAAAARRVWEELQARFAPGTHRDLVASMVSYVVGRER